MRVLLIEDNARLAAATAEGLMRAGFVVDAFGTAEDGEAALRATDYDALILDLGLPDDDGGAVLKRLRDRGQSLPVLILTARDSVEDRVKGLSAGADDYLLKPFALEELAARLRALLRRPGHILSQVMTLGDLSFDSGAREAKVKGETLSLSRREQDALELLMRRAGQVVSKQSLETTLYAYGEEVGSNAVEVLIHRLRKKLQGAESEAAIHTLRGVGYLLSDKSA